MNGYYGFSEEEIQEISEYDEEWGHLKTKVYPNSLASSELLERIETDPTHDAFYNYQKSVSGIAIMGLPFFVILLVFIVQTIPIQASPAQSIVAFVGVLGIVLLHYVYMYSSERKSARITNQLGIGWKAFGVAIEWDHIEWVDIGIENEEIKRIIFSGNRRHLWHVNGWMITRFTHEHLRRFLPDFETWRRSPMPGWPENYARYTRPERTEIE